MAFQISRIDRVARQYTITVTLPDGSATTIAAIDAALLPIRTSPSAATVWKTLPVVAGVVEIVYAGPEASSGASDLRPPLGGADLHMREVDGAFVKDTRIERITVT